MKKSISVVIAVLFAGGLSACAPTQAAKEPGPTEPTVSPTPTGQPFPHDPRCRDRFVCPR